MIAMTRESIKTNPPDILFSSTEMLSKQSTDWQTRSAARVEGPKRDTARAAGRGPHLHRCHGRPGRPDAPALAQCRIASSGRPSPVFVGLSATLRDAGDFMSTLTGVDRAQVESIAPASTDMLPTSREYGLVLRGDPVSGASLLSTTIQTAMLLSRVLDNQAGIYGSVAFAFTDDLDVINRLHDNLRDAEGHDPYGIARGRVLADLRSPANDQASARYPDGQSWDLPNKLGRMNRKMRVARTTSQDTGVDAAADIIVATSSLEVGFNDPRVGAVIQHKAPRDMASFLQRRGRAGRKLAMRPITAVVLSDYGRDRITYQSYERLLDPEISARTLPVGNRFVLKIQATHALARLDLPEDERRRALGDAGPAERGPCNNRTAEVAGLLARLLDRCRDPAGTRTCICDGALQITEDEANAVLWEEPRSLMLSVVPTALRRLESMEAAWATMTRAPRTREPLPEFMTRALFEPLNTPDVQFILPFKDGEPQTMAIAQALREAVPGSVQPALRACPVRPRDLAAGAGDGDELALTEVVARGHSLGSWTADGEEFRVVRPLGAQTREAGARRWCSRPRPTPSGARPSSTRLSPWLTSTFRSRRSGRSSWTGSGSACMSPAVRCRSDG